MNSIQNSYFAGENETHTIRIRFNTLLSFLISLNEDVS